MNEVFRLKNGKEVIIRKLTPDDIDAFLDLREAISHETTHTLQIPGKAPERETLLKRWTDQITHAVNLRLGAFDGKDMVAVIMFYQDEPHPWIKHIAKFGMYSRKAYWGQGIGRRLLDLIENHAAGCGITRIEALVRTQNDLGVNLYKKAGYTIEGTKKSAAFIDGVYQDEYFIAKILGDQNLSLNSSWRPPVLETKNLILRGLEESDSKALFEYAQDPVVSQYTLWSPHKSLDDSLSMIRDYAHKNYQEQECEPFGICLKDNPAKIIGTCGGWWKSKESKKMEIGYALSPGYWGKGIMTEALLAVIDHLFRANPELNRIEAHHKAENKGSGKVMEKCGMKLEGVVRSGIFSKGRFWDMPLYSILRSEWERSS